MAEEQVMTTAAEKMAAVVDYLIDMKNREYWAENGK